MENKTDTQNVQRTNERLWVNSETGVLVIDGDFHPIACNRAAASILNYPDGGKAAGDLKVQIPPEISVSIRALAVPNQSAITQFRAGRRMYVFRAYRLARCNDSQHDASLVLIIQRNPSATGAANDLAFRYHLTARERQVLQALCMGLSAKELADRMGITPSTAKAFSRHIMNTSGTCSRRDSLW